MKINPVQTAIAVAISLLITYGLYSASESENRLLLSVGSFVFLAATLIVTLGAKFELSRTAANIKITSGTFFIIAFISNLVFTFLYFSVPSYVIVNGILFFTFILITYSISKAKE
jgi:tetrahydromethanopterin S-methyltransferase subunit C